MANPDSERDTSRCVYQRDPLNCGDAAIQVCLTHAPDFGLYGDEWCSKDTGAAGVSVAGLARAIVTEIDVDIARGLIPPDVASSADLNDHVDGNDYLDAASVPWGTELPPGKRDPAGVRVVRAVQDEVTRRLRERTA
jgi:hypothetical protein